MKTTITITTEDRLPDAYDSWEDYFENYTIFLLGEDKDEVQFFIDNPHHTKLSVPLYHYVDEETGEKVYDTESMSMELGQQFTELTGRDWYDF